MLYRQESGHAPANLAFVVQNCNMIKGIAPKLYGYEIGHAPANLAREHFVKYHFMFMDDFLKIEQQKTVNLF